MVALGLIQLLPLRTADNAGLPLSPARALSLDPYSTRLVLVQITALLIYFVATLVFTDTPRRLRTIVRTITIFGFLLAMFGLTQSFTSDGTRVYWFRQLAQSTAFGPFINRHHFAGYMELAIALPLGLLFSGAIESYKRPIYAFAAVMMGVALIMTSSRGGIISLSAEILFLVVVAGPGVARGERLPRAQRVRSALLRAGLAFLLILLGKGFARGDTDDKFRRGVATGALAGCLAVLIHSFFDLSFHTTANAFLFLILAALATRDRRVDKGTRQRGRRRSQP